MKKSIIKILKSLDIFGTLITFQIKRDNDYKSLLGGIFSILYFLLVFLFVSYYTYFFVARKEINLIYSTNIVDSSPFVNLTAIDFNFAFSIKYPSSGSAYSEFEKYFKFSVRSREWLKNNEIKDHYFDYKLCSLSDFHYNLHDFFITNDLSNYFCPILDSSANFTLDGLYTDNYFKYLIIDINLTSYAMQHKDELRRLMEKHRFDFALYFMDTSIDYENRRNPLRKYINYQYKNLDIDFIKYFQVFISSLQFYNDENIIIENADLKKSLMFDNIADNFQYFPNRSEFNETLLGEIIIKASPKVYILKRNYQKLPIFIGELYGICEEFLQFLYLIVSFVEKKAVDRKLIQRMLKFRGSKYFDIDYLENNFKNKKVDEHVNKLISKERLSILKAGNIKAKRASVNDILISRHNLKQSELEVLEESERENKNESSEYNDSDRKLTTNNDNNNDDVKRSSSSIKSEETISNKSYNQNEMNKKEEDDIEEINTYDIYSNIYNRKKKKNKVKKNSMLGLKGNYFLNKDNYFSNKAIKKENTSTIKIHKKNDLSFIKSNKKLISLDDKKSKKKNFSKNLTSNTIKICEEKLGYYTTFDFVIAYCCNCCSKRLKNKYSLLRKCELKIHYYLDIYSYIKKMQEIDLIKYCLFDKEQIVLFNFLAKPPVKFSDKNIGIYKEFEKEQINYSKTGKKEMDEIFEAYSCIGKKTELTFEDIKLLRLVNADIDFLS